MSVNLKNQQRQARFSWKGDWSFWTRSQLGLFFQSFCGQRPNLFWNDRKNWVNSVI